MEGVPFSQFLEEPETEEYNSKNYESEGEDDSSVGDILPHQELEEPLLILNFPSLFIKALVSKIGGLVLELQLNDLCLAFLIVSINDDYMIVILLELFQLGVPTTSPRVVASYQWRIQGLPPSVVLFLWRRHDFKYY